MLTATPPPLPRIVAPVAPTPPAKPTLPLVATLAPVVMSLVLWLVTQSIFSLVFAALGPVVAVGGLVDSRRSGRRRAAAEAARFARELQQAEHEVDVAHDRERAQLAAEAPSARLLLAGPQHVHWGSDDPPVVVLGSTDGHSAVQLDLRAELRADDANSAALRELRDRAAVVRDAPLAIPAGRGIGIVGAPVQAAAFARGLAIQLLASCSPTMGEVCGDEPWLSELPHHVAKGRLSVGAVTLPIAREVTALAGVDTVVRLAGASAEIVRGRGSGTRFSPEYVSAEEARLWAALASDAALRSGLDTARIANICYFAELPPAQGALGSVIGTSTAGPLTIDLVADGPHAVVGGTTGSGKSELLVTWLLGIAASRSPAEVTMLLVDFKGGTSFGALPELPHCVGMVTDLDATGATRALSSLVAELRYRERVIAAAGARSITEVSGLARLVIAVDEFAAMAAELPELHALFADIAARGRSLGVHLVLCTQRPAGVVRDSVLANASLRVSLRVNNRADSSAVLGSDVAAHGAHVAGRAWVVRGAGEPEQLQVALATADDIASVARAWGAEWAPRRPWLDPLPAPLSPALVPGAIGLVDLPEEQAQRPIDWNPSAGSLLVVGCGASGKTGALEAIASVHGGVLVTKVEAAWDALMDPPPLLLIDNVDALVAALAPDYQQAFIDLLASALRSSASTLVLSAQRIGAALHQLTALCDHRILLRMSTRQEHVIAGGSSDSFDIGLPPGAGWWRGSRVQLVQVDRAQTADRAASVPLAGRSIGLAVSPRPQALAARLTVLGFDHVPVTDPEAFLADWGRFSTMARTLPVLYHECSPTEFRQLSRLRTLPPPIADPRDTGWLLEPEAEPVRVRLEGD